MTGLSGRVAAVTGAGGGVGRGIALSLGQAGATVVVAARRAATGEAVVAEIIKNGGRAVFVTCDVTDKGDIQRSVDRAEKEFGGLDVFIHNAVSARSSQPDALEEVGRSEFEEHFSVSVRAAWQCAQAAHSALARSESGRFILLSSSAGIEGSATLPLYSMVKGALRGMAKSLAREWGPEGITVNCLAPVARTEALERALVANPDLRDRLVGQIPLGRLGDPEVDIGSVARFLAGDDSAYMTGQTLMVDGGSFMGL
ncbi:MAG: SDR family NAD(P)-dependent oxidoreductase [Acidimicrobiales bacterium]